MGQKISNDLKFCCKRYAFISEPAQKNSQNDSGILLEVQECPYCGRKMRLRFKYIPTLPHAFVSEEAEYLSDFSLNLLS